MAENSTNKLTLSTTKVGRFSGLKCFGGAIRNTLEPLYPIALPGLVRSEDDHSMNGIKVKGNSSLRLKPRAFLPKEL